MNLETPLSTYNLTNWSNGTPIVIPNTSQEAPKSIPDSAVVDRFPVSEAQLEIWLASQQSPQANCAYNEISSLHFQGDLDLGALSRALQKTIQRHASLRSVFSSDGQFCLILESSQPQLNFVDWTSADNCDHSKRSTLVVEQEADTPFDLVNGPLIRFVLQKHSPTQHQLTLTAHHVVLDGWSLAVLCNDLGHFYDVELGQERKPLPMANDYKAYSADMSAYLKSAAGATDEQYWVDQFKDHIPVLDLPTDLKRSRLRTYQGGRYDHQFPPKLIERVRRAGAKQGCSLFNTMLAAFSAYIYRLTRNDDFCIGIPTAGQAAIDMPELIGHCVNTMPLRMSVSGKQPFTEYLKQSRTELLNGFEHQRYAYGTLLRKLAPPRDPGRPPMLNVSFNLDPMIDTSEIGFHGLDVQVAIEPRNFENFDWFVNGVILADKSIEMQVQYNADLFTDECLKFYFDGFEAFLSQLADRPEAPIDSHHTMTLEQRQQVIVDWNKTELEYPLHSTLHAEFSRQASQTPDQIAVRFGQQSLTYSEVESRSNQIARFLSKQGVQPGDLVGICVERSENMLVTLFGILKSGAGYVPLDPAYPADRLRYMCDHSGLKLVVTQSDLLQQVAEFGKPTLALDQHSSAISALDSSQPNLESAPQDTCYVIYTSGSTGKPKGVQVPHGTVVNFLYAMREQPGLGEQETVLALTTLSFDIAVLELYGPVCFGGTVVILDSLTAADGNELAKEIAHHDVTLMQATPATWRLLIQSGWQGKQDMRILCGGEPMPGDLVRPLLDRCSQLWNMYGPTETTVWSAAFQVTDENQILIGRPVGNTQIYVLDPEGNEVSPGCDGEIHIGGAGVTTGYLGRQDLTDERFVENRYRNPFTSYMNDRLYKTGDLARFHFNGNIEFLRRNDKQVKVRGYRIELGEIEQSLKSHSAIRQTVVIVREDSPGDTRLVAYLVEEPGATASPGDLRNHLRNSLPPYMIPQHFVTLTSMPQTNNGKIDYKQLPQPNNQTVQPESRSTENKIEPVLSPAESYLIKLWEEALEFDDIAVEDTFFDIGGHSLLVMKMIACVLEDTQVKLSPQDFLVSTLQQLASKLGSADLSVDLDNGPQKSTAAPSSDDLPAAKTETPAAPDQTQRPTLTGKLLRGFWD